MSADLGGHRPFQGARRRGDKEAKGGPVHPHGCLREGPNLFRFGRAGRATCVFPTAHGPPSVPRSPAAPTPGLHAGYGPGEFRATPLARRRHRRGARVGDRLPAGPATHSAAHPPVRGPAPAGQDRPPASPAVAAPAHRADPSRADPARRRTGRSHRRRERAPEPGHRHAGHRRVTVHAGHRRRPQPVRRGPAGGHPVRRRPHPPGSTWGSCPSPASPPCWCRRPPTGPQPNRPSPS